VKIERNELEKFAMNLGRLGLAYEDSNELVKIGISL
jgi:hypothetical protein